MVERWDITFPAPTGNEPRTVYVYLPESYKYNRRRRYPVLYMFDGHNVFFDEDATYGKSWGMNAYMEHTRMPLIIVGVECNHSPDHGRLKEYSPFTFEDGHFGHITGRGRTTMEWMVHTLKREIDRRYRTLRDRDHTFIAGSSMGGLMSLYAVTKYNSKFSKAACLSPSIWFASGQLDVLLKNSYIRPGTVIYMDYGSNEMRHHKNMAVRFRKVTGILLEKGVYLTSRIVPNGDHCEACWEKQIPFFIDLLLY